LPHRALGAVPVDPGCHDLTLRYPLKSARDIGLSCYSQSSIAEEQAMLLRLAFAVVLAAALPVPPRDAVAQDLLR